MSDDFRRMRRVHINTVRTYTLPDRVLLDKAARHGLRVIVGIPWAQHVAFLDSSRVRREIRQTVRDGVRALASHPAVLAFTLGNEIPPGVVRWYGAARVERFLRTLYRDAKSVAPDTLMAYVNFPPTEYLDTSEFDLCAFNVFLHQEERLRAYLARLQNVAGSKPLLLTELGADSIRHGEDGQAALTAMQLRVALAVGAAGAVAFSWTDEWWRGGEPVDDWAFGLVDARRRPKLAAAAVAQVFDGAPFPVERRRGWPKVSVLVCAYNAASTLEDCLESLQRLTYPDYEVIVIDDGSRDATAAIARRYPVTLVSVENGGLSAARNLALSHATGEIVAYTDSDVRADPDWLTYLVQPFLESDVVAAGGPNIVPPDDPWLAQCVARSPGGPIHVLLDDSTAEHVPGCNMAFRRQALLDIGGFDPIYRAAGDDVDVCWRLQARGQRVGFAPSALVWHHHRPSVRAYWRQQVGYGEAESWLMLHHPEKFLDGQARWRGRIYSPLPMLRTTSRVRINAGVWGTSPFPSVYSLHWPRVSFLPHLIQWQVAAVAAVAVGIALQVAGIEVPGRLLFWPGLLALMTTFGRCLFYGWRTDLRGVRMPRRLAWAAALRCRATIAWLHFLQPLARAWGRLRGRLWPPTPVVESGPAVVPRRRHRGVDLSVATGLLTGLGWRRAFWSEAWLDRVDWLAALANRLRRASVGRSVDVDDGWHQDRDLSVGLGRWGRLHLRTLVEEHAGGRCLLRLAGSISLATYGIAVLIVLAASALTAVAFGSPPALMAVLAVGVAALARAAVQGASIGTGVDRVVGQLARDTGLLPIRGGGQAASASPSVAPTAAGAAEAPAEPRPAQAAPYLRVVEPMYASGDSAPGDASGGVRS